ncbi:hypothetical protein ACQ0QQ_15950 [Lysinibacillus sphaericus]
MDFQMISEDIESLYHTYSKRLKIASEEISKERSKRGIYEIEISGNHETIEILMAQVDYLLKERDQTRNRFLEINKWFKQKYEKVPLQFYEAASIEGNEDLKVSESSCSREPAQISEVMIIYENEINEIKLIKEQLKKNMLDIFLNSKLFFKIDTIAGIELTPYIKLIERDLELIDEIRRRSGKKERWYMKMWRFLWGKPEEVFHPEIMKKLNKIEEQLVEYAGKFNEVNETLMNNKEKADLEDNYLEKMNKLHGELKKLEEYYEEEMEVLKGKLEEYKRREAELETKLSMMDESQNDSKINAGKREVELEEELKKLREELKSHSNKKSDLYQKMKVNAATAKKQPPQRNSEYEEYGKGNIPIPSDANKIMFDPSKYIR